ncbi:hypothetical protein [Bartonella sp. LJL80]
MVRFVVFLWVMVFAAGSVSAQSVSDVIGQDKQNNSKSADVTVFAFAYSLVKETDKAFLPMIENPAEAMRNACKMPTAKARHWVYMNAVLQYNQILKDIAALEKSLSVSGKAETGPVGTKMLAALAERRGLLETARALDLSSDVVEMRLEANDNAIDMALIEAGDAVASSAFNTFRDVDMAKIKTVPQDIKRLMEQTCMQDPIDDEGFIEKPAQ